MDYETYTNLGFKKLDKISFEKVVMNSELLISNLAHNYYDSHDIADDLNSEDPFDKFRVSQYGKAICVQCEYADEVGGSSLLEQQQSSLSDVNIGRTHLSRASNPINAVTYGNSGVYLPAYALLSSAGLLYCGVDSH